MLLRICNRRSILSLRSGISLSLLLIFYVGGVYYFSLSSSTVKTQGIETAFVQSQSQISSNEEETYFRIPDPYADRRGCKIPFIYPFKPSTLKLIEEQTAEKHPKPPQCEVKPDAQFKTNGDSSLIRISSVSSSKDEWLTKGYCCYKPYTALPPKFGITYLKTCFPINETVTLIPEVYENIQVLCKKKNKKDPIYRDYFHFFRLNSTAETVLEEREKQTRVPAEDRLSIIFFGLDSVAFTNFQRFLPKSRDFLVRNMSAVEFSGLNKVGRGTLENLTPTLSGCEFAFGNTIFPSADEDCYLIWEDFAAKGYRTVLSEEQFWFPIYKFMKRNGKGVHNTTYDNLAQIKGLQSTCVGARSKFGCFEHQLAARVLTDRILQVATKLDQKLYYHHLWCVLTSHDILAFAKYLDNPIYDLLTNLTSKSLLNNTVLIINSDHGTVTSQYSRTAPGLIEARVPLLYFVFPPWFSTKYTVAMDNLRRNSHGLTTHADIYETLREFLNLNAITNEMLESTPEIKYAGKGRSLFRPIPLSRNCNDAGVPDEYCICLSWEQLQNPKDLTVIKSVSFSMDYMNKALSSYGGCAFLDLEKILGGQMTTNGKNELIYKVTFQTIPGGGIFGATVKVEQTPITKFFIVGEIERQNLYGNQSACLGKELGEVGWIRSICYCK